MNADTAQVDGVACVKGGTPAAGPPPQDELPSEGRCTIHAERLATSPAVIARAATGLSDAERKRAATYRHDGDRARFEVGALLVRTVVGRICGVPGRAVTVDRTCDWCGRAHGRPRVPGSGLHLSVSHSGDIVVVAVSVDGPVGVDVEQVTGRGFFDHVALISRVFDASERAHITNAGEFLTSWTRKEAVLKATGNGLRVPPADVLVTPPHAAPDLLALRGRPRPHCRMADVDIGADYRAAVAVLTPSPVTFTVVEAALERRTTDAPQAPQS